MLHILNTTTNILHGVCKIHVFRKYIHKCQHYLRYITYLRQPQNVKGRMLQLLKLGQIVDETHNHIVDTYV